MKRLAAFLVAPLLLVALATPASAGRPRAVQILDQDTLLLPYIEQDNLYRLTYFRAFGGQAMLLDESPSTPLRVTTLGYTPPIGSDKGSYTATPDDTVWAAFSSSQGIRVYDLGDISQPGPLDPLLVDVIVAPSQYDPRKTQLGIIAILIGVVAEPRPALFAIDIGTSEAVVLGFDGERFRPVALIEEEGIFYFVTQ